MVRDGEWTEVRKILRHLLKKERSLWRSLIKPAWKSVLDAVRREHPEAGFFLHSCGDITPVLANVAEIGFHVLHPVQPECMDALLLKKKLGDRIVLCATLGAQRTLARGTPTEVADETTRLMDTLGADRRCLVCPSNRIQPETPWENVLAFERAARSRCGCRTTTRVRGCVVRVSLLCRGRGK